MQLRKRILTLLSPLLPFVVLPIPYSIVNQQLIVEWLGCGCPRLDEFGNYVEPGFNANDFTAVFWLFIALCATAIAGLLSRKLIKGKLLLRLLYIGGIFAASVFIAYQFYLAMMWN